MFTMLEVMTREEIARVAPQAAVVLPTAAIEQHEPHLPIVTDTLICGSVALSRWIPFHCKNRMGGNDGGS